MHRFKIKLLYNEEKREIFWSIDIQLGSFLLLSNIMELSDGVKTIKFW